MRSEKNAVECVFKQLTGYNDMTGLAAGYPGNNPRSLQMGLAVLPKINDLYKMKKHLYDEYRVEVPFIDWNERHFIRISVQGYII